MYTRMWPGFLFFLALSLRAAVGLHDTHEQVLAHKGPPVGKLQAGDILVLRYPDETIRLKAGKVVAIEAARRAEATATKKDADAAPPKSAPLPAATKAGPKPAPAAAPGKLSWMTDYRAALAKAKEENRRVFLFFTGSDWCSWCIRLNREILSTPEFARYAQDNLILVELDFPKGKSQSPQVKTQNSTLAKQFEIQGFPTVAVLDHDGRPIGRLGYQAGGPGPFLEKLKSL